MIKLLLFLAISVCHAGHLSVSQPDGQMLDRKVVIQIQDLAPKQLIELRAAAEDGEGKMWTSQAFFEADDRGLVDVSAQRPLKGSSYEETDGMGLFWSMEPESKDPLYNFNLKDISVVELGLYQDGRLIEKEIVTRCLNIAGLQRSEIRENGVVGVLFVPPSEKQLPVIITLTGSNGGVNETRSKLLASHGFAVLALGYFGMEGVPSNLENIPLEYFENALAWLKTQPQVDGSRIGLYGGSRGGELVLILGWHIPDAIQAIVSVVPTSVVNGGLAVEAINAWTHKGKPIHPFMRVPPEVYIESGLNSSTPTFARQMFLDDMDLLPEAFEAAAIPVEKIRCPLVLISGGDDQIWPSDIFSNQIIDRLKKHNSTIDCRHLYYPEAGHNIGIPHLPPYGPVFYHGVMHRWYTMGGTHAATQQANADSWEKLVAFFQESLCSKPVHNSVGNLSKRE